MVLVKRDCASGQVVRVIRGGTGYAVQCLSMSACYTWRSTERRFSHYCTAFLKIRYYTIIFSNMLAIMQMATLHDYIHKYSTFEIPC